MSNNARKHDRWGNVSPEPPGQRVAPPNAAWLGQGIPGLPPAPPPPSYGPSNSDYPPSPSFPLQLPPPSPPSMSTGSDSAYSTSVRFRPPGSSGVQSLPPNHPPMPPTAVAPLSRQITNHPSTSTSAATQTRPPQFTRPVCTTCHVNCVNVRESNTNFCERCFQDALRRRGAKGSSTANRPRCGVCHGNFVTVREAGVAYCERCWQETLRKRGVREDGSAWS